MKGREENFNKLCKYVCGFVSLLTIPLPPKDIIICTSQIRKPRSDKGEQISKDPIPRKRDQSLGRLVPKSGVYQGEANKGLSEVKVWEGV